MTMASGWYGITERDIKDTTALAVDFLTDTLRYVLVTDVHTPDFNADDFYADIDNELPNGNGYTTGGAAADSVTWAVSSGFVTLDATDETWAAMTQSNIEGMVLDDDTLTNDPLILAQDFGAPYSPSGGSFILQHDSNGIGRVDIIP